MEALYRLQRKSLPNNKYITNRGTLFHSVFLQKNLKHRRHKLNHFYFFLNDTTASITPYIGLFGTVIGIMNSFVGIAGAGSSSLGVVAPGIAEALIATAMGLFAAIPAVYFYNALTGQVKAFTVAMDDFAMEFLNIAERNFT